jgi:hypothetical protein
MPTLLPAWILYSLMANASIQVVEYVNRAGSDGFWRTLLLTWPFILVAQWGLYETWRHAPHFLTAWLFFTVGNAVMRLVVSKFFLGENFEWWGTLGIALMFGGAYVMKSALHGGVK